MKQKQNNFIPKLYFELDNIELLNKNNTNQLKTILRTNLFNKKYCKENSCIIISRLIKDKYKINVPLSYINKNWVLVLLDQNIGHVYHFITTKQNFRPVNIINKNYYRLLVNKDLKSNDVENFDFKLNQDITLFFYEKCY